MSRRTAKHPSMTPAGILTGLVLALTLVPQLEAAAAGGDIETVPLKALRAETGPIRLSGIQGSAQIALPVSSRQRLSDVELSLFVTNSIALTRRSQMAVSFNGSVIGQIPFKADHPETRARITVPERLIRPGYNEIGFAVAQHYADTCEDPSAPELWSEVDTTRSTIAYRAAPAPLRPTLADLPLLMDKRLIGDYRLTIATVADPDHQLVEAGGLIAQAAALARDYAPLVLDHAALPAAAPAAGGERGIGALASDLFGGGDGVLLASRDALAPWLEEDTYALAARPLLAVFPFGKAQDRFVLVVSGADESQVRQAARTLVQRYSSLPATATANIEEITTRPQPTRPTLGSGARQPFSEFGFRTATRQGVHPQPMVLRFWVPADRFAYPKDKLHLSLHLAYGAGLNPQSVLNVFLNDHFEHAIRLADPRGAVFYDYRIPIPLSSLAPGWNALEFRPALIPPRAEGHCQPIYMDNLLFTLFEDSYLVADPMMELAELPDLSLFARTGFPFAGGRRDSPVRLALTSRESGNLVAAWTVLAKLAQTGGAAVLDIRSLSPEQATGNTLLVGQLDDMPTSLLHRSPLRQGMRPPTPGPTAVNGQAAVMTVALEETAASDPTRGQLLVAQFQAPGANPGSVVLLAAGSPDLLAHQVKTVVDPAYWSQLAGGTAVLGLGSDGLHHYPAAASYLTGSAGNQARLSHTFTQRPALAVAVVLAGILLFAVVTWRLLLGYRRRQHVGQGV